MIGDCKMRNQVSILRRAYGTPLIMVVTFCMVFGAMAAVAQIWHPANSRIVAWDASEPPKDDSGTAYSGQMKYQIYIRKSAAGSEISKAGAEVTATQGTVTLPSAGRWFVGVDSVFYYTDFPDQPARSERIAWSDVAADCFEGKTFGIIYLPAPSAPAGLR